MSTLTLTFIRQSLVRKQAFRHEIITPIIESSMIMPLVLTAVQISWQWVPNGIEIHSTIDQSNHVMLFIARDLKRLSIYTDTRSSASNNEYENIYWLISQLILSNPTGQRHRYVSLLGIQSPPLRHGRELHGCWRQSSTLTPVRASGISFTDRSLMISCSSKVTATRKS